MKITVKVHPQSKKKEVIKVSDTEYKVYLTATPIENKANIQLIELLSEYFKIPKTTISIKRGGNSKIKIIELPF